MITFRPYGRTDTGEFFTISGLYWPKHTRSWDHYPALAFVVDQAAQQVRCRAFTDAREFAQLPDDIVAMQQWPGEGRSDFFHFTVGEARPYLPGPTRIRQATPADDDVTALPWEEAAR